MAEAAVAQPAWVLLAYLVAGVCFILALRGLSGPESSRRGNRTGMLGMAIAVITTLITHFPQVANPLKQPAGAMQDGLQVLPDLGTAGAILVAIVLGGTIGHVTAR